MSINLDSGLWRCFKTGETGNFVKLYSILEKCSYRQAYEKFVFENFLYEDEEVEEEDKPSNPDILGEIELVSDSEFIRSRFMDSFKFYKCKDGKYKGRLIIPFVNSNGKMFYFQARSLDGAMPKYLNCKSLKSSQILYPFDYTSYEPLYITEGVFDALSLRLCGFNATTTLSCYVSNEQMYQLKQYQGPLVCAFDNDKAGIEGRNKFLRLCRRHKLAGMHCVSPKEPFKDWNELLVSEGPDALIENAKKLLKLDELYLMVSGL